MGYSTHSYARFTPSSPRRSRRNGRKYSSQNPCASGATPWDGPGARPRAGPTPSTASSLDLVEHERSDHTRANYREDLDAFADWYEHRFQDAPTLALLAPSELREWKNHLRDDRKLEPATVNRKLAALRSLLRWAEAEGLAPEIAAPKSLRQVKPPPRWLDQLEQRSLIRAVERSGRPRDVDLVKLFLHTGLRVDEAVALRWDDLVIRDRSGTLIVRRGKGRKQRTIPLNAEARAALARLLAAAPKKAPEVLHGQRGPLTVRGIQAILKRVRGPGQDRRTSPPTSSAIASARTWPTRGPPSSSSPTSWATRAWRRPAATSSPATRTWPRPSRSSPAATTDRPADSGHLSRRDVLGYSGMPIVAPKHLSHPTAKEPTVEHRTHDRATRPPRARPLDPAGARGLSRLPGVRRSPMIYSQPDPTTPAEILGTCLYCGEWVVFARLEPPLDRPATHLRRLAPPRARRPPGRPGGRRPRPGLNRPGVSSPMLPAMPSPPRYRAVDGRDPRHSVVHPLYVHRAPNARPCE